MHLILDIRLLECAVIASIANGRHHIIDAEDFRSILKCHPIALFVTIGKRNVKNELKRKNRNGQT